MVCIRFYFKRLLVNPQTVSVASTRPIKALVPPPTRRTAMTGGSTRSKRKEGGVHNPVKGTRNEGNNFQTEEVTHLPVK